MAAVMQTIVVMAVVMHTMVVMAVVIHAIVVMVVVMHTMVVIHAIVVMAGSGDIYMSEHAARFECSLFCLIDLPGLLLKNKRLLVPRSTICRLPRCKEGPVTLLSSSSESLLSLDSSLVVLSFINVGRVGVGRVGVGCGASFVLCARDISLSPGGSLGPGCCQC